MNYQQTLDFIYQQLPMFHRVGGQAYKANLDNTIRLCQILGNPQDAFQSVHIAGTNGKGSVSHMLASILQTAGYRTGLYTSPHLVDFRERIRVNGKKINTSFVVSFFEKYKNQTEQISPSFFEWTVGLAFDYFRSQQVDIAVVETGLGGRLDSTNIIHPLLSVITNVSLDHTQFLGETIGEIAWEKAGIIKLCTPVVIGETDPLTKPVFCKAVTDNHGEIFFADKIYSVSKHWLSRGDYPRRYLDINKHSSYYLHGVQLPLPGLYQLKNVLTVLAACEQLVRLGYELKEEAIHGGIRDVVKNTDLQGRWQILKANPLVVCDTGHNEAGIREVMAQVEITPHKKLHMVFGAVNDKKLDLIIPLLPRDASYYLCKPDIPRGLDVELLSEIFMAAGLDFKASSSVREAYHEALNTAGPEDMILVGGSTFVVADVLKEKKSG
jgi:dihydrofolate synthase/folylpolyglutamate synthase